VIALLLPAALAAPLDLVLGGADAGTYAARAQVGFPWTGASAQVGVGKGWALRADYETASFARHQPALGVGYRWLDRRWRITGEAMAGWVYQPGTLAQSGPSGELRIRAGRTGRVVPIVNLGMQGILPLTRTVVISDGGEERSLSADTGLTLTGGLGVAVPIGARLAAEAGLDLDWVDVPTISIPGAYVAISVAGGER